MKLDGKTIWITGASSGIGEATACEIAKCGLNIILTARNRAKLEDVRKRCIANGSQCEILPFDLCNIDGLGTLTEQAIALFGRVDIVFSNAGISQRSLTADTDFVVDKKIMDINFFAAAKIAKAILPHFIANGGGTFVVTTSISGKFGFPLRSAYAASKFALYGFFETIRAEYFRSNVRVTFVCPGRVRTNISLYALEGDGTPHNRLDAGQATGIPAERAAKKIVKAIKKQRKEVLVGAKELLLVHIKRFCPALAWKIIRTTKST